MKSSNSLLDLMIDTTGLALEAQSVIAMRMTLFAFGGPRAEKEKRLMVDEKIKAATDLMFSSMLDLSTGGNPAHIMPKAVKAYRKIVGRNQKRLSRG